MELEVKNITKTYGKKRALDDFLLKLTSGVYGLLEPNGAGKPTLISDPNVLIFDEPTAGLDPKERVRFRNII